MRIIGGTHRSRRLLAPRDAQTTRPMPDRVRQGLFDRLWDLGVLEQEPGPRALDLFCGTGPLGLEALSRGAVHCTFVDSDRGARRRLEENLRTLGLGGRATVVGADALATVWLELAWTAPAERFDLVFCDPPYRLTAQPREAARVHALVERLATRCADGAILVLRTDRFARVDPVPGWIGPVSRRYGSTVLHYYQRPLPAD